MKRKKEPSVEIPLSNSSLKSVIDEEDYLLISAFRWRIQKDLRTSTQYVITSKRDGRRVSTIRLHRLVMNAQAGMDVHHIDYDPLNNRKENLQEIPAELHRGRPKSH